MKNKRKQPFLILIWYMMAILSACGSYPIEEETEEASASPPCNLSLDIKSRVSDEIPYPISVYLFDTDGNLVTHQELTEAGTLFQQNLKAGNYTLSAFTASDRKGYVFPDNPDKNSLISITAPYFTESPIMSGSSSIKLEKKTEASILLEYAMSSLYFKFSDIPQETTRVEVTVSPVSSGIDLFTDYSGQQTSTTIPCVKNNDIWEAGPAYVFPAAGSKTILSISIENPDGNKTYAYTYNRPLEPAQPYQFTGQYNDEEGIILTGQFEASDWKPTIDIEFGIGGNTSDDPEDGSGNNQDTPGSDTFYVNELPEADNIWGYFYVWKVETVSETEIIATLISPDQWFLLAGEALPTLADYAPDGITGWRTFTSEEAKEFKNNFINDLAELNEFLTDNNMLPFYAFGEERYLCNNCQSTFGFLSDRITKAGEKTKYYLRGIKTVRIKKH